MELGVVGRTEGVAPCFRRLDPAAHDGLRAGVRHDDRACHPSRLDVQRLTLDRLTLEAPGFLRILGLGEWWPG